MFYSNLSKCLAAVFLLSTALGVLQEVSATSNVSDDLLPKFIDEAMTTGDSKTYLNFVLTNKRFSSIVHKFSDVTKMKLFNRINKKVKKEPNSERSRELWKRAVESSTTINYDNLLKFDYLPNFREELSEYHTVRQDVIGYEKDDHDKVEKKLIDLGDFKYLNLYLVVTCSNQDYDTAAPYLMKLVKFHPDWFQKLKQNPASLPHNINTVNKDELVLCWSYMNVTDKGVQKNLDEAYKTLKTAAQVSGKPDIEAYLTTVEVSGVSLNQRNKVQEELEATGKISKK